MSSDTNNKEYKIESMDDLDLVVKKWKDIESRVEYVATKIAQLTNDGLVPINFLINPEKCETLLIYNDSDKMRVFPSEILLFVPDEAIVEELIKHCLDYVVLTEGGLLVKAPKENTGQEEKKE